MPFKRSFYKSHRNDVSNCCGSEYLVLRDLAEDEVPEFLRLVAEVENSSVLADDPELLLADVDDQLRPEDGVVAGSHDAHLEASSPISKISEIIVVGVEKLWLAPQKESKTKTKAFQVVREG